MRFSEKFERLRQEMVRSETNPDRMVASSSLSAPVEFRGFLDSQASVESSEATRDSVSATATLFLEDVDFDIRRGDRVRSGDRLWRVVGFPPAPMNPFSGWRPYREVRLMEVQG